MSPDFDEYECDQFQPWGPALAIQAEGVSRSILPSIDQAEDQFERSLLAAVEQLGQIEFPVGFLKNVDFWDERKEAKWRLSCILVKGEALTIPKPAVASLKQTTLTYTSLAPDDQFEQEVVTRAYQPFESLETEVLMARQGRKRKFPPGPKKVIKAFDKQNTSNPIYNDKVLCDMWDINNASLPTKFDTIPFYTQNREIIEVVKRKTATFSKVRHFSLTEHPTKPFTDLEREPTANEPKPIFEPPLSPPLVPRPTPLVDKPAQIGVYQTQVVLDQLGQDKPIRTVPTSPSGKHSLNQRMNQMEGILPMSTSSTRPLSPGRGVAHPLWSSDMAGPSSPSREDGQHEKLEPPIFGRPATSASIPSLEAVLQPRPPNQTREDAPTKSTQAGERSPMAPYTDPDQLDAFAYDDQAFTARVRPVAYADYQTSDPQPPEDYVFEFETLGRYPHVVWPEVPPPVEFDLPTEPWIGLKGLEVFLSWQPWTERKGETIETIAAGQDNLTEFQTAKTARDRLRVGIYQGLAEPVELLTDVEKADAPLVIWPELVEADGDKDILPAREGGFALSPTPNGRGSTYLGTLNLHGKRARSPPSFAAYSSGPPSKLGSPRTGRVAISPDGQSEGAEMDSSAALVGHPAAESDLDGQSEIPPLPSGLLDPLSEHSSDDEIEIVNPSGETGLSLGRQLQRQGAHDFSTAEPDSTAASFTGFNRNRMTEEIERRAGGEVLVIKLGSARLGSRASDTHGHHLVDEPSDVSPPADGPAASARPPTPPLPATAHLPARAVEPIRSPRPPRASAGPSAALDVNALLAAKLKARPSTAADPSSSLASFIELKKATVAIEQPISFASRQRIRQANEAAAAAAKVAAAPPPPVAAQQTAKPASLLEPSATEPPYDQLALARPRFEVDLVEITGEPDKVTRVVGTMDFMQMRAVTRAVQGQQGLQVVVRPMRWPPQKGRQLEPHLILDGVTCVFFRQVATVAGNAVRKAGVPTVSGKAEAWSETARRMAGGYDRVLLVAIQAAGPGVPATWTPPNIRALNDLAEEIKAIERDCVGCRVEVAFAAGEGEAGEVVKGYVEWLESEAAKEEARARKMTGVGLDGGEIEVWGGRGWLTDEQGEEERRFLESSELNALSASALAGVVGFDEFVYRLTSEERRRRFGRVVGGARIDRISDSITVPLTVASEEDLELEQEGTASDTVRASSSPPPSALSSGSAAMGGWQEIHLAGGSDPADGSGSYARDSEMGEAGGEMLWQAQAGDDDFDDFGDFDGGHEEREKAEEWWAGSSSGRTRKRGAVATAAKAAKATTVAKASTAPTTRWRGYDDGGGGVMRWDDRGEMYRGR